MYFLIPALAYYKNSQYLCLIIFKNYAIWQEKQSNR